MSGLPLSTAQSFALTEPPPSSPSPLPTPFPSVASPPLPYETRPPVQSAPFPAPPSLPFPLTHPSPSSPSVLPLYLSHPVPPSSPGRLASVSAASSQLPPIPAADVPLAFDLSADNRPVFSTYAELYSYVTQHATARGFEVRQRVSGNQAEGPRNGKLKCWCHRSPLPIDVPPMLSSFPPERVPVLSNTSLASGQLRVQGWPLYPSTGDCRGRGLYWGYNCRVLL